MSAASSNPTQRTTPGWEQRVAKSAAAPGGGGGALPASGEPSGLAASDGPPSTSGVPGALAPSAPPSEVGVPCNETRHAASETTSAKPTGHTRTSMIVPPLLRLPQEWGGRSNDRSRQ